MRVEARDDFALDESAADGASARRFTPEGYLLAPATIARVGVQEYTRAELGLPGVGKIRLHRPEDEVFAADAIASFENKPVTDGHPREDVTAGNWTRLARGEVRDVAVSKTGITARVIIKDAALAAKAAPGQNAPLSCGYSFDLDQTPGMTADGRAFDGVMRKIRGNHVAVVSKARGGPECRIADGVTMRKITIDEVSFELEETAADLVAKLSSERDAARKASDAAGTALAQAVAARDEAAKQAAEASPEKIAARVADTLKASAEARVLDAAHETDACDALTVRREALAKITDAMLIAVRDAVLGGVTLVEASADLVARTMAAAVATRKTASAKRAGDLALGAALRAPGGVGVSVGALLSAEQINRQNYSAGRG